MISSIHRYFCPVSYTLKQAYNGFKTLPLLEKIQMVAFTAFAAISSLLLFGLFAIPAFIPNEKNNDTKLKQILL